MPSDVEKKVQESITSLLGLSFEENPLNLLLPEKVDGWIKLDEDRLLILEVEDKQKHPTTNVLKQWRFLDRNPNLSVILVHVFLPDSNGVKSSRGELAFWLGKKLEQVLSGRFYYHRLIIDRTFSMWSYLNLKVSGIETRQMGEEELLEIINIQ